MKEHLYYTYIVASRSLNLYVGFTSDLIYRVKQHKEGAYEGYPSNTSATVSSGMNDMETSTSR
jgi:predicted GIY-YIG superfamily endonuclease